METMQLHLSRSVNSVLGNEKAYAYCTAMYCTEGTVHSNPLQIDHQVDHRVGSGTCEQYSDVDIVEASGGPLWNSYCSMFCKNQGQTILI